MNLAVMQMVVTLFVNIVLLESLVFPMDVKNVIQDNVRFYFFLTQH